MSVSFASPWDVRPEVAAFEPYEPGLSIEEIRRKYGLDRVIKLASNENPLGVSPRVRRVLCDRADQAFRYPRAGNPRLVAALAAHLGVDPARVFAGNGSDEVIDLLFRVRAVPGEHNAVAFRPCFGLYPTQARMAGVELRRAPLNPDFSFDFDGLLALVDERTTLVFVTSPDNPSGRAAPADELERLARSLPPACLLVVDEAYAEFAGPEWSLLPRLDDLPNVALMRTFSKIYGLAGLRVGYAVLPPRLADYLWRVRLPFSLNILAEEAAVAALDDVSFREATVRLVIAGRERLAAGLVGMGCDVLPSRSNFLMFRPPASGPSARDLHQGLLARGVIIRSLGSYELPDWLRVTVGTEEENECFLDGCRVLLREGKRSGGGRA